jgi:hypothetical protein
VYNYCENFFHISFVVQSVYNCYVESITLLNKTDFYTSIITEATQIVL